MIVKTLDLSVLAVARRRGGVEMEGVPSLYLAVRGPWEHGNLVIEGNTKSEARFTLLPTYTFGCVEGRSGVSFNGKA